jgi:hypothetical protein
MVCDDKGDTSRVKLITEFSGYLEWGRARIDDDDCGRRKVLIGEVRSGADHDIAPVLRRDHH